MWRNCYGLKFITGRNLECKGNKDFDSPEWREKQPVHISMHLNFLWKVINLRNKNELFLSSKAYRRKKKSRSLDPKKKLANQETIWIKLGTTEDDHTESAYKFIELWKVIVRSVYRWGMLTEGLKVFMYTYRGPRPHTNVGETPGTRRSESSWNLRCACQLCFQKQIFEGWLSSFAWRGESAPNPYGFNIMHIRNPSVFWGG